MKQFIILSQEDLDKQLLSSYYRGKADALDDALKELDRREKNENRNDSKFIKER